MDRKIKECLRYAKLNPESKIIDRFFLGGGFLKIKVKPSII